MMCLTVHQPYAHLFFLAEENPDWKGVENRDWSTSFRGPLLIHAGKNRSVMTDAYLQAFPDLPFGAIVGIVDMVDCFEVENGEAPAEMIEKYPWLQDHMHVSGPFCHVYANPRRFVEPIDYVGQQKFYHVEDSIVEDAIETAVRDS